MPLCGFNQKMLQSLQSFHEGFVEHGLIERSRLKSTTIESTLQRELQDMDRFLQETQAIENPELRNMITSLTNYARSFYQLIEKRGFSEHPQTLKSLLTVYEKMDRKYYTELEGKPDDMKELVAYLNEQTI